MLGSTSHDDPLTVGVVRHGMMTARRRYGPYRDTPPDSDFVGIPDGTDNRLETWKTFSVVTATASQRNASATSTGSRQTKSKVA